jgi:hypothetical protein
MEIIKAYRKRGNDLYADILSAELERTMMMEQMQQQQAMVPPTPQLEGGQPAPALPQGFGGQGAEAPPPRPRTLIAGPGG